MGTTGRAKFLKFNRAIQIAILIVGLLPPNVNYWLLGFFRNTNGLKGIALRYLFVKNLAKSCGDNVYIGSGVYLLNLPNISFGNNVSIHPMCYIDGAGGVSIFNNISIAHSTSILSTNHTWSMPDVPIKYNPEHSEPVVIESDVWVGCGCRILAGVTIGMRSVIAAGAVLNKSVRGGAVYAGVPAREIKKLRAFDSEDQ